MDLPSFAGVAIWAKNMIVSLAAEVKDPLFSQTGVNSIASQECALPFIKSSPEDMSCTMVLSDRCQLQGLAVDI